MGVAVKFAAGGRDLRVHLTGFKHRKLAVLCARLTKYAGALRRRSKLANDNSRAPKLIKGAVIPQALRGVEGLGLSPTQLFILCRQVAGASGCTAHGRCATNAAYCC